MRRMWAFRVYDVMLYTGEPKAVAQHSIERHTRNGILRRLGGGYYTMNIPQCIPSNAEFDMARWLRPFHITYYSLESRLSEFGIISQIPVIGTFATTGRSGRLETGIGTIEYTHVSTRVRPSDVYWDKDRRTWVATPKRALEDLKRTGRNLGLVDMELYEEVQTEFLEGELKCKNF